MTDEGVPGLAILRNLAARAIGRSRAARRVGVDALQDAEEVIGNEPGLTDPEREALRLIGGDASVRLARTCGSSRLLSEDSARLVREGLAKQAGRIAKLVDNEPIIEARKSYVVLLVDDEPNLLKVIARFLRRAGHEVFACSDFESAQLHLVNGISPDLLITDIVLKGSTGKRVAAAVLQLSPRTRVVFMSGYSNISVGGQTVLQKPFTSTELIRLVDEVMSADTANDAHEREEAFSQSRKKLH